MEAYGLPPRGSWYGNSDGYGDDFTSVMSVQDLLRRGRISGVDHAYHRRKCCTPLHIAAEVGAVEVCEFLIANGGDINDRNEDCDTPLHFAARAGKAGVCACLLAHGAEPNPRTKRGATLLWLAARAGYSTVCDVLLSHGADVHAICERSPFSALACACLAGSIDCCSLLVSHGADVTGKGGDPDRSPLAIAIRGGHLHVCPWLVERGADVDWVFRSVGGSVLLDATQHNRPELVEWVLQRGISARATGKYDTPALLRTTHVKTCETLLAYGADVNQTNEDGVTPLHNAALVCAPQVCKLLIDEGAIAVAEDVDGSTPLSKAMHSGHVPSRRTAHSGRTTICQLLVAHGASISSLLPHIDTQVEVYVSVCRDAGWKRRLHAFAAYVSTHGVWWE